MTTKIPVTTPTSYRVDAEWDDTGWWVVTVPEVPGAITQVRRLDQVAEEAAEVIEIQTGQSVDPAGVVVVPRMDDEAGRAASDALALRQEATALSRHAGESTRRAVRLLSRRGFTVRDIGTMTGIAHQRAHQILAEEKKTAADGRG